MRKYCCTLFFIVLIAGSGLFQPDCSVASEAGLQAEQQMATLYGKGKYKAALAVGKDIYRHRQQTLGNDHDSTVSIMITLGKIHKTLGHYDPAYKLFRQALDIRTKLHGRDSLLTAEAEAALAGAMVVSGDFSHAEPLLLHVLSVRKKMLGESDIKVASAMVKLADLYYRTSRFEQARQLFQDAISIQESKLGLQHPYVAKTYDSLARVFQMMGEFELAKIIYQKALAIKRATLRQNHPSLGTSYSALGQVNLSLGDFSKAKPFFEKALSLRVEALGYSHPLVAASYNNLGLLFDRMGDYANAAEMYQKALTLAVKIHGQGHKSLIAPYMGLSNAYRETASFEKSIRLLEKTLAIVKHVYGLEDVNAALVYYRFGKTYRDMGKLSEAGKMFTYAMGIYKNKFGMQHKAVAAAMNNLAMIYMKKGEYTKAEDYFKRSLAIVQTILSPDHYQTSVALNRLAVLYGYEQKPKKSLALFQQAFRIESRHILNVFSIASEKQRMNLINKMIHEPVYGFHVSLSLINHYFHDDQDALRYGLEMVFARKAIVFDAQSRQQQVIARSLNPAAKKTWGKLNAARSRLAKLLMGSSSHAKRAIIKKKVERLQSTIEKLEASLASSSQLVADQLKIRHATVAAVAGRLAKHSVLVEFVRMQGRDWIRGTKTTAPEYLAFILHADGRIELKNLGNAVVLDHAIDRLIQPFHTVASVSEHLDEQIQASRALYEKIWRPLEKNLNHPDVVMISPDGALNLVPFAAMQNDRGEFVIENTIVSYVTSGRDLIARNHFDAKLDLAIVANPDFDYSTNAYARGSSAASSVATRSVDFSMRFNPLPGTGKEAAAIPALIAGKRQLVLTGKDATEVSVLAISRPRILHLATHGFFLKDQMAEAGENQRGVHFKINKPVADQTLTIQSLSAAPAKQPPVIQNQVENPLVRSGLVLAGANLAAESKSSLDGLLTAMEVTNMDLNGTELVTLSACESGAGEVHAGEGVFGLRRAFVIAGAQNLLMSLWPVLDNVTAEQMYHFYKLYGKGEMPAKAFRNAQLDTIKSLRAVFGKAPPSHWAPFFIQGPVHSRIL